MARLGAVIGFSTPVINSLVYPSSRFCDTRKSRGETVMRRLDRISLVNSHSDGDEAIAEANRWIDETTRDYLDEALLKCFENTRDELTDHLLHASDKCR